MPDAFASAAETDGGCNMGPHSISLIVHGVRSDDGNVTVVLYGSDPDDFLVKGRKLLRKRSPAMNGIVRFCLAVSKPGVYAVAAYHDENGNKKFDKNWIGIPIEGFGVSNSPEIFLLPPGHAEAAFRIDKAITKVDIELGY